MDDRWEASMEDHDLIDQFWKQMEDMPREKARTIFRQFAASSPQTLIILQNLAADEESIRSGN